MPTVITHNYHPGRGPFRNLCSLPLDQAEHVVSSLRAEYGVFRKPDYLSRRLATERWLMSERTRKLGVTPLLRPIYFFLGDMADGSDASRPASLILRLAEFDPRMLTFTITDSMTSCPEFRSLRGSSPPYHGQVFSFPEIAQIVARIGVPDPRTARVRRGPGGFVEVQVWDDRPLRACRGRDAATRGTWRTGPSSIRSVVPTSSIP